MHDKKLLDLPINTIFSYIKNIAINYLYRKFLILIFTDEIYISCLK